MYYGVELFSCTISRYYRKCSIFNQHMHSLYGYIGRACRCFSTKYSTPTSPMVMGSAFVILHIRHLATLLPLYAYRHNHTSNDTRIRIVHLICYINPYHFSDVESEATSQRNLLMARILIYKLYGASP